MNSLHHWTRTVRRRLGVAVAFLVLTLALSHPALAQSVSGSSYVVQTGDSYQSIAARHGISLDQLQTLNPGLALHVPAAEGQVIYVPIAGLVAGAHVPTTNTTTNTCPQRHNVNPNETLAWIGGAYGVPVQELASLNRLQTNSPIQPGQVLCLPAYARLSHSPSAVTVNPAPSSSATSIPAPTSGHAPVGPWDAAFFNTAGTPRQVLARRDPRISFNWGTQIPAAGVAPDHFSAVWTGLFQFSGGNYRFVAIADDGVRVWVGNTLIIDGWKDQSATLYFRDYAPPAGTHAVRVEYYDSGVDARITVDWAQN